ncbi:MAG: hypothetical protein F4169_20930 [Gammaproteobacteria bacterium]|nr:hypothetical protein [Gammaproteobacteria bacterium]
MIAIKPRPSQLIAASRIARARGVSLASATALAGISDLQFQWIDAWATIHDPDSERATPDILQDLATHLRERHGDH